jgi:SulP family sulfate permease
MARMSEGAAVTTGADHDESDDAGQREHLPPGVEVFAIEGPFFFGVAQTLIDAFKRIGAPPRIIILRLERVPFLDASGAIAVHELLAEAQRGGIGIILCGVRPDLMRSLEPLLAQHGTAPPLLAADYVQALRMATP